MSRYLFPRVRIRGSSCYTSCEAERAENAGNAGNVGNVGNVGNGEKKESVLLVNGEFLSSAFGTANVKLRSWVLKGSR
jgi:hypothetical protein